ncbi:MAG: alpha/beta hydrolase [Chloroflexi bacterium]|nr:alpha/beta hydrolase [Chloroflexota bacterium]
MTAESRWVEAHGLRLHYLDWGGDGPPVLLLHGLQDCAGLWETLAEGIGGRYHVMALDHRGHGDSPWAASYRLADYVAEAGAVIEALDLRDLVLVGHSAGSKNAFIHVAEHPERIARLVITDMDPDALNPGSVAMISRYKNESDEYPSLEAVIERLRTRQPGSSAGVLRSNAAALTKPAAGGAGLVWKRDRDVVTRYDRPDAWASLPRVSVPTLIVRGAESTLLTGPVARRMRDAIPDCRLVEIDGCGHWAHLEAPEAYERALVDFLEG